MNSNLLGASVAPEEAAAAIVVVAVVVEAVVAGVGALALARVVGSNKSGSLRSP